MYEFVPGILSIKPIFIIEYFISVVMEDLSLILNVNICRLFGIILFETDNSESAESAYCVCDGFTATVKVYRWVLNKQFPWISNSGKLLELRNMFVIIKGIPGEI